MIQATVHPLRHVRLRRLLITLALANAAGGCSTAAPPAVDAAAAPASWSTPTASLPASAGSSAGTGQDWTRWWSSFGDPALPPLIERALQASPTLAQAEARLRQARAQRDATAAALGPSVSLGASARTSRSEAQATSQAYELGPDASWEPDLWGGSRAGVAAADSNVRASVAGLASVRLALAAEVSLQVLQARGLQARLAIARRNLNSQQQTLNIARWRREAGLVTELDVQQAQASVSQTAAQIPSLVASLRQTEHALAVLTGQPVGSVRLVEGSLPHAPAALSFVMPAEVLRQRPDVVAAEAQLQAAAARVAQAQAQRLPSLTLGGSIGLSALRLSALGAGAGLASLAASVRLPLFDGGRLQALVRVQDAAFHEARAAYQATVLGAIQDVEDNLMAIGQTHQQLEHLRTAAAASQAAARLAEQRYASGLIDFSAVLVAQRTQLSADDALATASTSLNTLHVRLFKALGGGWLPGEGPAVQRSEGAP